MAENIRETGAPEQPETSRETRQVVDGVADRPDDRDSAWQDTRRAVQAEYLKATVDASPAADQMTRPTGERGGVPDGQPTQISPRAQAYERQSIEGENNAAVVLADRGGYHVKQSPGRDEVARSRREHGDSGTPEKNPDYLVEGRVFDCYTPTADKPVRGIATECEKKVLRGQTERVVVNLENWRGNVSDLQQQFDDWPVDNLKEVKVITRGGDILQCVPKSAEKREK